MFIYKGHYMLFKHSLFIYIARTPVVFTSYIPQSNFQFNILSIITLRDSEQNNLAA